MEAAIENKILQELNKLGTELHEFREENDRRWEQTNKRLDQTNERIDESNKRITALEEGRKKDRNDILIVLEAMQESINNQFTEMREYVDAKFEKIFAIQRANDIEHEKFRKYMYAHNKRLDFHSARLGYLEKWKEDFDLGSYTAV